MWNDKETDVDLLGHDKIAQTVIEIINDNHLRPLTIGIYGDWGVGKSSILSLLQSTIKTENELGISKSHCILFNGWLFQGYEDARSALMEIIVSELAKLQPGHKKIQKLAKSLLGKIDWLKLAKASTGAVITGLTATPGAGIIAGVTELLKKGENESFSKEDKKDTVTSQIHSFRNEFQQLISASKIDHIIVLIDDLDRCLPKSIIEILEAMRLFLFVEGTTFVLSADEKMIEYAVKEHFPNLPNNYSDYPKNYLEKLIQIPIRIPLLNRLQTGNYIRLLMLQQHLKHDYSKLKEIYEVYNSKKKRPYDPVELSYEIIKQAIGKDSTELQETLHIAAQLTPTLAAGLKGNPRNIKRFLNTLFLRMRISKIYGLNDIVKLNVLAKLMLLERFQVDRFDSVVEEVSIAVEGYSEIIGQIEKEAIEGKDDENDDKDHKVFKNWALIDPTLSSIDLRPYIFISKEKAIGFDSNTILPEHLEKIYEELNSNADIALNRAEKKLQDITHKELALLFEKLESESRSVSDLKKLPSSINGLLRIIKFDSSFEDRFMRIIAIYPSPSLGVWAISELLGLKKPTAIESFKKLLKDWSIQDGNNHLKSLAQQQLK